ncbi:MAG: MFS transporter [Candidatus Desulfofervidaceae bacterium]|nr:MFS transporter [Candidatus Desulfofervidaceae bacterium]
MSKQVFLVCVVVFPFMICSGIVYSILSLYFAKLGATKSQIGFIYTSGALAGAAMAPFLGRLADKWGRKVILFMSMGLFMLLFLGYALSKCCFHLFLIQIAEGIAWSAMGTSATALLADVAPVAHRGEAMGIYNTAWSIGWIIGPSLGGISSDHLGFKLTFLICAGIMLFGIILGMRLLQKAVKDV